MDGLTKMQYQYKNLHMFSIFFYRIFKKKNIKHQFSMYSIFNGFLNDYPFEVLRSKMLEIVISDQLVVNNIIRHVFDVIKYVLIPNRRVFL